MWVAGASRPEWCFVAEDESGARVGRVGYRVEPTVTNPAWLGTLPPAELFPFGLWLPWEHGGCDLGRVLFATTLGRLAPELPARLDVEVNPEVDDHPRERVRLFDDIGMDLFQEKEGFTWRNSGAPIPPPGRLRFATAARDRARPLPGRDGPGGPGHPRPQRPLVPRPHGRGPLGGPDDGVPAGGGLGVLVGRLRRGR